MAKLPDIRVGVVQPGIIPGDVESNLDRLSKQLHELKKQGVRLAVLPEFFPTGNTLAPELLKTAIQYSETVSEWLSTRSRDLDMMIAGSYLRLEKGEVYNTFVFQEPAGSVACHRKTHAPVPEAPYYRVSPEPDYIVDTSLGKIGLIICIETFYPEIICRDYTGCALILINFAIPNMFSLFPPVMYRLLRTPRELSRRNGVPVVLCSMGGRFRSGGSPVMLLKLRGRYVGRSGIYLPDGPLAGPLGPGEDDLLVADVPLGPGVAPPDSDTRVKAGLPLPFRIYDRMLIKRAERIYEENMARWHSGA